ncbi:hypothetical protein OS493_022775 [Desmophyllum pertusum]|uniref:Uncharacterized protein n=1 Tax=Desmophyllum pertusum TaxID=174260 RepID=A0A9W9YAM1_9CNID|nr:hypothetical protein OS493_022775 [Desmophyllum pertusum]
MDMRRVLGQHGLGEMNENGERLADLCALKQQEIQNISAGRESEKRCRRCLRSPPSRYTSQAETKEELDRNSTPNATGMTPDA